MHARPLPRILEVAFNVISGDFGGGRIGTVSFLLTMTRGSPEGEGQALFLTTTVCSSGEEGTGPPLHTSGLYFGGRGTGPLPHNVSAFDVYLLAEQISAFSVNQGEVVNYGILLGAMAR